MISNRIMKKKELVKIGSLWIRIARPFQIELHRIMAIRVGERSLSLSLSKHDYSPQDILPSLVQSNFKWFKWWGLLPFSWDIPSQSEMYQLGKPRVYICPFSIILVCLLTPLKIFEFFKWVQPTFKWLNPAESGSFWTGWLSLSHIHTKVHPHTQHLSSWHTHNVFMGSN